MKFNKIFDNLNKSVSYNLFSLIGIINLIFKILCVTKIENNSITHFIDFFFFSACYIMTLIIALLEPVFEIQIKNRYLINNKIIVIVKTIGAAVGFIQVLFLITIFIMAIITSPSFS